MISGTVHNPKAKAFFYLRVSTDDKGQDPMNQLADCLQYALERKFVESEDEVQVWREEAGAWGKTNRPVFDEMMSQAWKRKIPILLVWDYDRLYRDRKKLLQTLRNYGSVGVKILSVRQSWLQKILEIPDPFNEMFYDLMLHMVAWMAEEESLKKSERVKIAYNRRKVGAERFGNKVVWGRKTVMTPEIIALVLEHHNAAPTLSIRKLTERITLSSGRKVSKDIVHRILSEKGSPKNESKKGDFCSDSERVLSETEKPRSGFDVRMDIEYRSEKEKLEKSLICDPYGDSFRAEKVLMNLGNAFEGMRVCIRCGGSFMPVGGCPDLACPSCRDVFAAELGTTKSEGVLQDG